MSLNWPPPRDLSLAQSSPFLNPADWWSYSWAPGMIESSSFLSLSSWRNVRFRGLSACGSNGLPRDLRDSFQPSWWKAARKEVLSVSSFASRASWNRVFFLSFETKFLIMLWTAAHIFGLLKSFSSHFIFL